MSDAIVGERARGIVMALGVVSLVASVVAMVYGKKLSPRDISPYDSYGRGPLGTRVFVEMLPRLGITAVRETDISRVRATDRPVIFLGPEAPSQEIDGHIVTLAEVVEARALAGRMTIVVLPKWRLSDMGVAEPIDGAEVTALANTSGISIETNRHGSRTSRPKSRELHTEGLDGARVELPYPQTLIGGHRVLASIDEGALIVTSEDETTLVVADSDLVSNFAVHRSDHAKLLASLLREYDIRSVVVDETFHGRHATKSLAEALGEWPGVLLLFQGAFLVAAVLVAGSRRFGRPKRPRAAYGRGPKESIAVAADVLTLGRAPTRLVARYVDLMIRDTQRRTATHEDGHHLGADEAAALLDRLAEPRRKPSGARALLDESRAMLAAKMRKRDSLERALDLARRAHALRKAWLGHDVAVRGTK